MELFMEMEFLKNGKIIPNLNTGSIISIDLSEQHTVPKTVLPYA